MFLISCICFPAPGGESRALPGALARRQDMNYEKTIEKDPRPECVENRQKQQESKDRTGHKLRQRCISTE